jgi:very-short-patch-repair endonuclease
LAANTNSRAVLVLPRALEGHPGLDHVSYASCLLVEPERRSRPRTEPAPPIGLATHSLSASDLRSGTPQVGTSPILGQPAPRSDAEQLLHAHLCRDPELGRLFGFNLRVRTRFDTTPVVDVLWQEGRLAIEIDGRDHRGETQYSMDRRRDYELTLSGYTVLRFPSGKVIEFAAVVVEEIREAVQYIAQRSKRS